MERRNCVVSSGELGDPARGENAVTIRWIWSKLMRDKLNPSTQADELGQAKPAAELQLEKSAASKRRDYRPSGSFHPDSSAAAELLASSVQAAGGLQPGSSLAAGGLQSISSRAPVELCPGTAQAGVPVAVVSLAASTS